MVLLGSSFFLSPSAPVSSERRDEVYVSTMPLRATKGPAQLLVAAAYALNLWEMKHYMVLVRPSSSSSLSQAIVFDFQPQDPENLFVALAALSGRKVPGIIRVRSVAALPRQRSFVGFCKGNGICMADSFNRNWETNLEIRKHDCRHYTNSLVEYLTGEAHVLERLRGLRGDDI